MEVIFKTKHLQKVCTLEKKRIKAFGKNCANKILSRLDDLLVARTLEGFRFLPGRCHELTGDRKGQLSLDLEHPYRLIFIPSNEDIRRKDDGGLDWSSVTAIEIIGVEDTHGS